MTSTEMVIAEKYEVADLDDIAELAEELDGLEGVPFDRVKIPSGGGIAWELPSDDPDNPEIAKEIIGVIVDDHPASALWLDRKSDDGETNPPDAYSMDGKTQIVREESIEKFEARGLPIPHEDMETCPYNKFPKEGGIVLDDDQGKGKATKNVWRLYVLTEGAFLPILVTMPPTSLKGFKTFKRNRVLGRKKKLCDVVVKLTLKKESGGGHDYSVVQFALVGALDAEAREGMRKMQAAIRPLTRRVELTQSDYDMDGSDTLPDSAPPAPSPADDEVPM